MGWTSHLQLYQQQAQQQLQHLQLLHQLTCR
jgi:hypothetical protein